MSLRDLMHEKPVIAIVAMIALIGAAVTMSRRGAAPAPQNSTGQYFMDLKSGEIFTAPLDAASPMPATSERGESVRAYVYSCGACDPSQWQVLYVETLTPKAAELASSQEQEPELVNVSDVLSGTLIAAPPAAGKEPRWLTKGTPQAMPLETSFLKLCNGGRAQHCRP